MLDGTTTVWDEVDRDRFRSQRLCGVPVLDGTSGVEVKQRTVGFGAMIDGTTSCKSVNGVCPVCEASGRERRRRELEPMVARGLDLGYRFALVTGTLKHTRETGVAQQRKALESAWRACSSHVTRAGWRDAGIIAGTVRSIEFMLEGPAGPHGHIHALIAVAPHVTDESVRTVLEKLGKTWGDYAQRHMDGLRPDDAHGWICELTDQPLDVAAYVTKMVDGTEAMSLRASDGWNLTHEVTRADAKRGGKSMTPQELLAKAVQAFEAGDMAPMLRFARYAQDVKGMRSIVVSKSFREALSAEIDDADDIADEWRTIGHIDAADWYRAQRSIGTGVLLDIAAREGPEGLRRVLKRIGGALRPPSLGDSVPL